VKLTPVLRSLAAAALLVTAAAAPVACSPATTEAPAEHSEAGVKKVVADFKTAWEAQNYDAMIDLSMPQPLLDQIIKQYGGPSDLSTEQLSKEIKTMMAGVLAQVQMVEFSIDDNAVNMLTSPTGRKHALLPSVVVVEVQGTRMRASASYLAFVENGRWYLIDSSSPESFDALKIAFPDLAGLTMPEAKMEVISQ